MSDEPFLSQEDIFDANMFELDFVTAMLMLGDHNLTLDQARAEAFKWYKEARE